jgi:MFS family permease
VGGAPPLILAFEQNLPAFLIAMSLLGATSSALSVGPSAVVGDVVAGRGGTVVAAFGMSSDVGAVCGPVIAGALAEHVSYKAAFCSTAMVLGLGLLMSLRMPETVGRGRPVEQVTPTEDVPEAAPPAAAG